MLLNDIAGDFILLCWLTFLVVWLIAAFSVKRTVERQSWGWRFVGIGTALAVFLLFRYGGALSTDMGVLLWAPTLLVGLVADAVTLSGLLITLWARFTLGGNWSSDVAFKENHELIERGPYHFVRHPIYSGILLMGLGTVILAGRAGGFVGLAIIFVGVWFKALQEEKLMTKHFPQAYPEYKARVKALIPFAF